MAGKNVGRVEFIVGANGKNLENELQTAATKGARKGGKAASKEFNEQWLKGYEATLAESGKRALVRWRQTGKLSGDKFNSGFSAALEAGAKKWVADAKRNLQQVRLDPKFLDRFAKGFSGPTEAIERLTAQFQDLRTNGIIPTDRDLNSYIVTLNNWAHAANQAAAANKKQSTALRTIGNAAKKATPSVKALTSAIGGGKGGGGGGGGDEGPSRWDKFLKGLGPVTGDFKQILAIVVLVISGMQQMATIASGLAGSLVALFSAVTFAAGAGLVTVGALGVALAWMATKATAAFEMLSEAAPIVKASSANLERAVIADTHAFAVHWGGALAEFQNKLAQLWRDDIMAEQAGRALARITQAFTGVISSSSYQAFQTAMETTLPTALALIGQAAASISEGLLRIFAVAGPLIARLAARIAEFWGAWQKGIDESAASGGLAQTLDAMFRSLNSVLDLIEALGGAFGTVFTAGWAAGDRLLQTIVGLVEQFDRWAESFEGQTALAEWFNQSETIFSAILTMVGEVGASFARMVTPESVRLTLEFINNLGKGMLFLEGLVTSLGRLDIFGLVAELFATVGNSLRPILAIVGPLAAIIRDVLVISFNQLAAILNLLSPIFLPIQIGFEMLARMVRYAVEQMQPFWDAMARVGEVVMEVGGIITNVVMTAFEAFIQAVGNAIPGPDELARIIDDEVIPAIRGIADIIVLATPFLIEMAKGIANFIIPALKFMWEATTTVTGALIDIFNWINSVTATVSNWGPLGPAIAAVINPAWAAANALSAMGSGAINAANGVVALHAALGSGKGPLKPGATNLPVPLSDEWRKQFKIDQEKAKWDKMVGDWQKSLSGIGQIFSGIGTPGGSGTAASGGGGSAAKAKKKFEAWTNTVIKGLTDPLKKGRDEAARAVSSIIAKIRDAQGLSTARKSKLVKYVQAQGKLLDAAWKKAEASAEKLAAAQEKLADLKNQREALIDNLSSSLSGGLNLESAIGSTGTTTFAKVSSLVSNYAAKMKTFAGQLKDLAARGIPPTLLQEIASLGVLAGSEIARVMLAASNAEITQLSTDWNEIAKWSDTAATVVGDAMFNVGIQAQAGLVAGLVKDTKALEAAAKKIADTLTKYIKKNLGIKSPSRVMMGVGQQVIAGLAAGLRRLSPVRRAMGGVAGAIADGVGAAGLALATGSSRIAGSAAAAAVRAPSGGVVSGGSGKIVTISPGAVQINGDQNPHRTALLVVNRLADRIAG